MNIVSCTAVRIAVAMTTAVLAFSATAGGSFAQSDPAPDPLAALIEEGWQSNQELAGIRANIEALKDTATAAGALDDPRLGVALLNLPTDSFNFDQEPMTQKQISISQRFPWFGTLDLKSRRVLLQAVAQESVWQAKRNELARKIADAYWELAFIDVSLSVNERLSAMVGQLVRVAESRYAAGKGLQQDVLQGQVELSRLTEERLTLSKRRKVAERGINALINRTEYRPVRTGTPGSLPDVDAYDLPALREMVLQAHPLVAARRAGIDLADVDVELAEKDYYPDFNLQMAYGQRDDDPMGRERADFFSAGVQMTLPLWQQKKQDRSVSAAKKRKESARRAYAGLAESLPYRADAAVEEIRSLLENHRLYKDGLLVQAGHWVASALAAYQVGSIEFSTMIEAQIRLVKMELQQEGYRYAVLRKHAELLEILGGSAEPAAWTGGAAVSVAAAGSSAKPEKETRQ